ncbi:MAG: pilus assembly protein PilM [Myxococcaceae bacterium]
MARILGLDLGSHSVKAVLIESTMRGYAVKGYSRVVAPKGERLEALKGALAELMAKQPLQAEQVVVALPGPSLATHQMTLPFSDVKRIEATIPFEIESQLPFDLTEAVFDYQIAATREKASDLLIGVVRKDELRGLLEVLAAHKLDPRIVTLPGMAYQNLLLAAPSCFVDAGGGPDDAVAVLDLGHERTTLAIGRPGVGVELVRTFAGGGKDLTRGLATEFGVSPEEAAEWKEAHGVIGAAAASRGPDAERASAAFIRALQPILRDLRATLKNHAARTRRTVSKVYLCGGTARLPGLDAQLSRDLNLPAKLLTLPPEAAVVPREDQLPAAQALSLSLRGQASGARAPRFNLRRGEFAFKGDFDYLRERVGLLASFAAILFILMVASGIVRNSVLARRERQVDAMLCDTTQRVLGQCEKNYDKALNLLKGKESPTAVIPKLSAVGLLAELLQRMPTDIPLTMDQMVVDTDRITVRCETDSSKQVDKITTALKAYRCFREVKEGKVEKSKDGTKVTFRLDIQVECPDSHLPQG